MLHVLGQVNIDDWYMPTQYVLLGLLNISRVMFPFKYGVIFVSLSYFVQVEHHL